MVSRHMADRYLKNGADLQYFMLRVDMVREESGARPYVHPQRGPLSPHFNAAASWSRWANTPTGATPL